MKNTKRLHSLDAFRGFTIAGMILVNTPGSWNQLYPPLAHADWHGCTPTDLIFPFFLFIVGVSMWYSFKKNNNEWSPAIGRKIFQRALTLFVIGLLIHAFPFYNFSWANFRILGVLQRIGIAFGLAAPIALWLKTPGKLSIFSTLLLLLYWWILHTFGGAEPYSLESNVVRKLDIWILGEAHLWSGKGIPFDPEGLLSSLPAVVSVLLGYISGRQLDLLERKGLISLMLKAGIGITILGWYWSLTFPLNKSLWTSSYVLLTSGLALMTLALFVWLIDIKRYQRWATPLLVFGTNSLFAYVLSMIWVKLLWTLEWTTASGKVTSAYTGIYEDWMLPLAGPMNGSLLFAILHVLFFLGIVWLLYQKKIFIKI